MFISGDPDAPTLGVEEEFVLLDPGTGLVVPVADRVIRESRLPLAVVAESMRFVVETRSPVCPTLGELHRSLAATRRRVADIATRHGVVLVGSGVAPFGLPDPPPVTDEPRYLELARSFPDAMRTNGFCEVTGWASHRLRPRGPTPPLVADSAGVGRPPTQ